MFPARSHLVIKAQLGNDIRKIPIHNEELTCDELLLMMQRIFKGHLGSNDEVTIKYKDSDNDLVTITDNTDLSFAIQSCRGDPTLRLILLVNDQPKPMETDEVKMLRKELCEIRNRINYLLDNLDTSRQQTPDPALESSVSDDHPLPHVQVTESQEMGGKVAMFDPLKSHQSTVHTDDLAHTANKVASAFGLAPEEMANSRSGSPNSQSSHGSSKPLKQQSQLVTASFPNSTDPHGTQPFPQSSQAIYPVPQSAPPEPPNPGFNPAYPPQNAPGLVPQPGPMGGPASQPGPMGGPVPQPGPMGGPAPQPGPMGGPVPQPGPMGGPAPQPGPMGGPAPQPGPMGGPVPQPGPMGGPAPGAGIPYKQLRSSHPLTNSRPGESVYSQTGQPNPYQPQYYPTPPQPATAPAPSSTTSSPGWNPPNVYHPGYGNANPNAYRPGDGQYVAGTPHVVAPGGRGSPTCPGSPNPYSRQQQQRGPAAGYAKAYQPGYQ